MSRCRHYRRWEQEEHLKRWVFSSITENWLTKLVVLQILTLLLVWFNEDMYYYCQGTTTHMLCHRAYLGPFTRCWPTMSPRASLFLQRLPRPASGSSLHCWQPSIFASDSLATYGAIEMCFDWLIDWFGCWPSGAGHQRLRQHRLWRPAALYSRRFCSHRLIWHFCVYALIVVTLAVF